MSIDTYVNNTMTIVGYRPAAAPVPSCCSDPSVLCANCANHALPTANRSGERGDRTSDDLLLLPSMAWESPESRHPKTEGIAVNWDTDEDLLPLPKMEWDSPLFSEAMTNEPVVNRYEDDDMLPLPTML